MTEKKIIRIKISEFIEQIKPEILSYIDGKAYLGYAIYGYAEEYEPDTDDYFVTEPDIHISIFRVHNRNDYFHSEDTQSKDTFFLSDVEGFLTVEKGYLEITEGFMDNLYTYVKQKLFNRIMGVDRSNIGID